MSGHVSAEEHEKALAAAREAGRAEETARIAKIAEICAGNLQMLAAAVEMSVDSPDLPVEKIMAWCRKHVGNLPNPGAIALAEADPLGRA